MRICCVEMLVTFFGVLPVETTNRTEILEVDPLNLAQHR